MYLELNKIRYFNPVSYIFRLKLSAPFSVGRLQLLKLKIDFVFKVFLHKVYLSPTHTIRQAKARYKLVRYYVWISDLCCSCIHTIILCFCIHHAVSRLISQTVRAMHDEIYMKSSKKTGLSFCVKQTWNQETSLSPKNNTLWLH